MSKKKGVTLQETLHVLIDDKTLLEVSKNIIQNDFTLGVGSILESLHTVTSFRPISSLMNLLLGVP